MALIIWSRPRCSRTRPEDGQSGMHRAGCFRQLFGHPLVRDLAGRGGAGFNCCSGWCILHGRVRALLLLLGKLPLGLEPVIFRIAGAALTLLNLIGPLLDPLILAGGDGCGRHCVGYDHLPSLKPPEQ